MRQYAVSLKGKDPVGLNYRGCVVILKEGQVYEGDSEIYKFYPQYFEPLAYYKETHPEPSVEVKETVVESEDVELVETVEEKPKKKRVSKKVTPVDEFSEEINTNENDVIIETSNQSKDVE